MLLLNLRGREKKTLGIFGLLEHSVTITHKCKNSKLWQKKCKQCIYFYHKVEVNA